MQFAAFRNYARVQVLAAGVAISALLAGAGAPRAAECGDLAGKVFGQATIVAATSVSPPSSLLGKDPPTRVAVRAPFCRVQGVIKPSDDSDISFEVWLPPQSAWNGKYGAIGNGGFAGSLILPSMAWRLEEGYAVSGGAQSMRRRERPKRSSTHTMARRPVGPILRDVQTAVARR